MSAPPRHCTAAATLCVAGEGAVIHGGVRYPLRQGDSYLLPAALGDCAVEGACRVLLSRV